MANQCNMDIIQPDISLCGGFAEALFIAEMAALSGIRCIPHCWGSDIIIAATVQLLSLLPDPHWGSSTDTPLMSLNCQRVLTNGNMAVVLGVNLPHQVTKA